MPELTAPPTPRRHQCRHILALGHRCGSPSLRNQDFCYYHHASRRPIPESHLKAQALGYPVEPILHLPPLEDRASVQLALSDLYHRIASRLIDLKTANALLYTLQIASSNLPREPRRPAISRMAHSSRHPRDQWEGSGQSASEITGLPHPEPIEDVLFDPSLGPLAPIADYIPPAPPQSSESDLDEDGDPRPSDMVERFLHRLNQDRIQHERDHAHPNLPTQPNPPHPDPIQPDARPIATTLPILQACADENRAFAALDPNPTSSLTNDAAPSTGNPNAPPTGDAQPDHPTPAPSVLSPSLCDLFDCPCPSPSSHPPKPFHTSVKPIRLSDLPAYPIIIHTLHAVADDTYYPTDSWRRRRRHHHQTPRTNNLPA